MDENERIQGARSAEKNSTWLYFAFHTCYDHCAISQTKSNFIATRAWKQN